MDKEVGFAEEIGKEILTAAADLGKRLLKFAIKGIGKAGRSAFSALKSRVTRKLLRKGRKYLRITALLSGCIAVLSCAGLILSYRK